jgi:hypothetical protein
MTTRMMHRLLRAPIGPHTQRQAVGPQAYGGMSVSELKRLRDLEAENAKLKRMYADLATENTAIKDVLSRKL